MVAARRRKQGRIGMRLKMRSETLGRNGSG
jgi:hypothetical protein